MFQIGVVVQFEAAHRLKGDFGPATRLHGHTYRVEVAARGPALAEDGTLCDLSVLDGAAREAVAALHLRDLDEVPALVGRNTTAEAVALHLHGAVAGRLAGRGLVSLAVRVWESPDRFAGYEAPVP